MLVYPHHLPELPDSEVILVVDEYGTGMKVSLFMASSQRTVSTARQEKFNNDLFPFLERQGYEVKPVPTIGVDVLIHLFQRQVQMHKANDPAADPMFKTVVKVMHRSKDSRMDVSASKAVLSRFTKPKDNKP